MSTPQNQDAMEDALWRVILAGDEDLVLSRIDGTDLKDPRRDNHGRTALMIAAQKGYAVVVKKLIDATADIDVCDTLSKTALMYAAEAGKFSVTQLLMERGANVNMEDNNERTALMMAAENGHHEAVNALLEGGTEVLEANMSISEDSYRRSTKELSRIRVDVNSRDKQKKTALMLAAANGKSMVVDALVKAGAAVNAELRKDGETALTLVREELVLANLAQSALDSKRPISIKIEEESIRKLLYSEENVTEMEPHDYVKVIMNAYIDDNFTSKERKDMANKFARVPVYKKIRENLLKAGGYDVREIKNRQTRRKIQDIMRHIDDELLREILKEADDETNRDAVFSMLELMADDTAFTSRLPSQFSFLPKPTATGTTKNSILHYLAEAGNVKALGSLLGRTKEGDRIEHVPTECWVNSSLQPNENGNTFLHIFAEKHNLKDLFAELGKKELLDDCVKGILKVTNGNGNTFLAVAVTNVNIKETVRGKHAMAKGVQEAMDQMAKLFEEETLCSMCEITDKKLNTLLHLAVQNSLKDLACYLIPKIPNCTEQFNLDGHNPLQAAVYKNDAEIVRCIGKTLNINQPMSNKETALHIAAKQGNTDVLTELIKCGGDLSMQDDDGHTPLHDCLQQVYFEGGYDEEEKCEKFFKVWNKIVEEAVTWWCLKHTEFESSKDPQKYQEYQRKAVYYLRSCIENKDGLTVLQYAADRGLVSCVQMMLTTKDVFVIPPETKQSAQGRLHFRIDVTNLCPEYRVTPKIMYTQKEIINLQQKHQMERNSSKMSYPSTQEDENLVKLVRGRGKEELEKSTYLADPSDMKSTNRSGSAKFPTFVDALAKVKPANKAGEILESIPMITLTRLQWRRYQWFSILWMVIHFGLMSFLTYQSKRELVANRKGFMERSIITSKLDVLILIYASFIFVTNLMVRMRRRICMNKLTDQEHEMIKDDNGILSNVTKFVKCLLDQAEIIVEFFFATFTWAVYIAKITNLNTGDYAWIKGFFLLFGWLLLLIPLRSYSPVYKLIAVLKYITITDMFPWILLYITISSAFASAIQLQFQLLPNSPTCIDEEHEMKGTLPDYIHALFELILMTTGLDTEITQVQNVACVFEHHHKKSYSTIFLITLYAVISAVVLLNMLIAIMSNTVTEAQQGKGWRQYQVHQALWLREILKGISSFFHCLCCRSKGTPRSDDPRGSIPANTTTLSNLTGNISSSAGEFELEAMLSNSESQQEDEEGNSPQNRNYRQSNSQRDDQLQIKADKDFCMDRWVRGQKYFKEAKAQRLKAVQSKNLSKENVLEKNDGQEKSITQGEMKRKVQYDQEARRWYLKLEPLEVKEIRARHLIT